MEQLRELKQIFEADMRERDEKEKQAMAALKRIYKTTMDSLSVEEAERSSNEKMLLGVVEQLINRIMEE